ncbi:LptF/LptG family permease [Urechidicola croceus]|uniref:Permease n=1 Tax=Urechidicola croceus TaxID=1850246 RepID=A0A1D8P5U9_9FLAO|nr:LptF/LptG family permease [Urechidicola croceus]AOW19951.1 permease [Urechidicola croceus]
MKKLDIYILKSFIQPFFATFFVILFVLVLQAVWVGFDEISGKGVDMSFILKFVGYLTLTVVPMAMPIGILLSSIMALGNFAENYEFAAVKSAGISLRRFIMPVMIFTIFLSGINFLFLNYVYPHATLKQKNMFLNVKKKQPALALVAGTFNTEIPGYTIKFDEKYGEEQNFLRNVQISDLKANKGKLKVITAKDAEITTEEGSKYMTFILKDGHYYEELTNKRDKKDERIKMPASKATFDTYTINIDISSFNNDDLESEKYKNHHQMLSLNQLRNQSDTTKINYDKYIKNRSDQLYFALGGDRLLKNVDTLKTKNLDIDILKNFDLSKKVNIVTAAIQNVNREIINMTNSTESFKIKRKTLNLFDHEFHNRLAFSFACLVLFFIGAPLGSIIRKGGFGLPMVMAIIIFVIYFFISSFGRNLAEESAISASLGGWLSTIVLLPFGVILTMRAAKDKGMFNIDTFFNSFNKFFRRIKLKKDKAKR